MDKGVGKNIAYFLAIRKFFENTERGTSHGTPEIYGIHAIEEQCKTIGYNINVFTGGLIYRVIAKLKRYQEHEQIQQIGVNDGCSIKSQTTGKYGK
jgi:hypothetical protein